MPVTYRWAIRYVGSTVCAVAWMQNGVTQSSLAGTRGNCISGAALRRHCLDVHAKAAMVVDTGRVVEILAEVLEPVMHGESVQALQRPWPPVRAMVESFASSMWWLKV